MSLFTNATTAAAELRAGYLRSPLLAGQTFTDAFLLGQLQAAEADASHALRVFFEPVECLPESATQAERDALDATGTRWIEEPGYDLEDEFFQGDRWGYLAVRQKPIIRVTNYRFVYPLPATGIFTVPADWIRLDKKYGHVRLVPGSQAFAAPLAIGMLQAFGAGRGIPQAVHIRYTAGMTNAAQQYPDLLDLIKRMAVLRVLQGLFLPTSGSISADGLSESQSIDMAKYQMDIDAQLKRLDQAINGIKVCFA